MDMSLIDYETRSLQRYYGRRQGKGYMIAAGRNLHQRINDMPKGQRQQITKEINQKETETF